MNLAIVLLLISSFMATTAYYDPQHNNQNPVVTTPLGTIRGALLKSRLGKTIYAFRGIAYAKPPVGELRFKPPVPIDHYEDVYDATEDKPMCPQVTTFPVNEDCLILNVYSTKLPDKDSNVKRPVIVHIHPGGFWGSGSPSYLGGPQYFMDQDIILVTLNYRLGTLGFLATGDKHSPGNNGMKDQVQALRWVSYIKLGESQEDFYEFGYNPVLMWTPVVEPDFGQERFLIDQPVKLIQEKKFQQVPFMTGVTTHEFDYKAFEILDDSTLTKELDKNWETLAPVILQYERDSNISRNATSGLKKYFLEDQPIANNSETATGLGYMYADALIGFGGNRAAKLISQYSSQPVYYYKFSYKGKYSHYYTPASNYTEAIGPVHHDELIYLFYISVLFPEFEATTPVEIEMVVKLTKLLANFATHGNPTPQPSDDLDDVTWEQFSPSNFKYLDIGKTLLMSEQLYEDRYKEWDKLFPLNHYSQNITDGYLS